MKELYFDNPGRRTYPEVSYTVVSHTIRWLVGVDADAPKSTVSTLPQLPDEVSWVEADNVPVGAWKLKIRQDGNAKTTLTNGSDSSINWEIRFYGIYDTISLDGVNQAATVSELNGVTISSIQTTVESGQTNVAVPLNSKSTPMNRSIP